MMISLVTITLSLTVGLVLFNFAYGQSLDELEKQTNQTAGYRAELLGYIKSHNMTLTSDPSLFDTSNLERIVKQHMEDYKSGAREEKLKSYEEAVGEKVDPNSIFGTC